MRRLRPGISVTLFVLVAFLLPIGLFAAWAGDTIYNSDSFSRRAVQLLDSPVAQKQLATQITDQLAQSGYKPAVEFRPALLFGVQVAVGTDAFRAIFRDAIKQFHAGLLADNETGSGLNLADALTVITSTVQLPSSAQGSASGSSGLGETLQNVTQKLSDLRIWDLENIVGGIALVALGLSIVLSIAGVAIALDRRKAILRLGLALALGGVLLLLLRLAGLFAVRRTIGDAALAKAIQDGLAHATNDLKIIGLGLLSYGAVIAAAVSRARLMPRDLATRVRGWNERMQRRRRTWVVPSLVLIVVGVSVASDTSGTIEAFAYVVGLYLVYLGVHELVAHIRIRTTDGGSVEVAHEGRRLALAATAIVVVLAVVTSGIVFATRRAASSAQTVGARECNGSADFCDVPLDEVVFPGTHNSMSSSQYSGWLFGEQIATLTGQLDSGVRALLIDTHYGVPTNVRIPGADAPLVVTDRAAELSAPPGGEDDQNLNPQLQERAQALAARQAKASQAKRAIYLCHNYCELGAVSFSSAMTEVKRFLDTHPDQVVLLDIQDAATPADTSAVIQATGLAEYAYTLDHAKPLPTLGELVDQNKRLLVFAEQGGQGAPPWYMRMYSWFQETSYSFTSTELFNCRPNRGAADNPLFLLNHWISVAPPDPSVAARANAKDVLERRVEACIEQRRLVPNIIAVDFSTKGQVVNEVKELNQLRAELRRNSASAEQSPGSRSAPSASPTIITPPPPPSSIGATATTGTTLPAPRLTPVNTLTGGDPSAFCSLYGERYLILTDYALAALSDGTEFPGQADFAYAPLLQGTIAAFVAVSPRELVTLLQPLARRTQASLDALTALGVATDAIQQLSRTAQDALKRGIDPLNIESENIKTLEAAVGADKLTAAGQRFVATKGDPSTALNLGRVSPAAATAAGYTCLAS